MLLQGKRIFIVEDKPANLAVMKTILEGHAAVVRYDRWTLEIISRMRDFMPVDLILMDLMFPNKVTGYDLFDQIRAVPEFALIPIVAVSASEPAEAIPLTQAKGFAGFIAKPIDYDRFPQQVAYILNQESIWVAR
jgi:two-component system cell cycle response regulator DivK